MKVLSLRSPTSALDDAAEALAEILVAQWESKRAGTTELKSTGATILPALEDKTDSDITFTNKPAGLARVPFAR